MTFEQWIATKIKEDSSFGDLARDYKSACEVDAMNGRAIEPLNEEHLCRWNATQGAHNALAKAIKQYHKEIQQ
jgi:non-canonical (house-cleaning) NTP pyrophosphatase